MSCNPENIMDPEIHNNEDNECKITIINNDCLAHIFSFLSPKELIKIERVCKWWQFVSLESWSTLKKVDAEAMLRWNRSRSDKPLKCILKHCGKYVKYLTVDLYYSDLKVVSKYCADLQRLEVFNFHLRKKIRDLSAFRHIEELKIFGGKITDKRVHHLFELCPNLRAITFFKAEDPFGQSIIPRFQSLEKLEIISCRDFHMKNVIANLRSMENLKSLSIAATKDQVNEEQFIQTIESLPNLEHLRFSGCRKWSPYTFRIYPMHLPAGIPKHIISLDVRENSYISDDLLKKVAADCENLEYLNISGCNQVTEVGVRALSKLPRLKYLTLGFRKWLSDKDVVTDYELELFALKGKLVKLKIRQNSKITDEGCIKIVSLCEGLEHFDISGCSLVTDATIDAAETALKYRTNDKKLKLLVKGTSVSNIEKWKNVASLSVSDDKYYWSLTVDPEMNERNECYAFGGYRNYFSRYDFKPPDDILESDSDESTNSESNEFHRGCRVYHFSYFSDSDDD